MGDRGKPGYQGVRGKQGERGLPGFDGLAGERGPVGRPGRAGAQGAQGYAGAPGERGLAAPLPPGPKSRGFYFTRHSQTEVVPDCPANTVKLWDGYSLLHIMSNGNPHVQDLGILF